MNHLNNRTQQPIISTINSNKRSLLSLAGQSSLQLYGHQQPQHLKYPQNASKFSATSKGMTPEMKKLIQKLTMPRLRKMQGLIRGFLCRRITYRRRKEQVTLRECTNMIQQQILCKVISKECDTMVIKTLGGGQQEQQSLEGQQMRLLQRLLFDSVYVRMCQKQLRPLIQQCLTYQAKYHSQPQITFGFNLRNPLELILYSKVMEVMHKQLKKMVQESIKQYSLQIRQNQLMLQWIDKYQMLIPLLQEIAIQSLQDNMGQYVVDSIFQRIVGQGCTIVARVVHQDLQSDKQCQQLELIKNVIKEWIVQEAVLQQTLDRQS